MLNLLQFVECYGNKSFGELKLDIMHTREAPGLVIIFEGSSLWLHENNYLLQI